MKIYVGVVNGEVVAYHDNKKVMKTYLKNYKETNPTDFVSLYQMEKKVAKEKPNYYNYWLIGCNETFVQTKYEHILSMFSEYDHKVILVNQLYDLLAKTKKKKDRNVLLEAIKIVESNKKRCGTYTPSLNVLNEEYWRYEQYRTDMYLY